MGLHVAWWIPTFCIQIPEAADGTIIIGQIEKLNDEATYVNDCSHQNIEYKQTLLAKVASNNYLLKWINLTPVWQPKRPYPQEKLEASN